VSYAAVFPLVRTRAFSGAFDYSIPPDLEDRVRPGVLVAVPLGPQTVIGVVLAVGDSTAHTGRVVPVRDLLDVPAIPADLLELAREVERYYLTSFSAALALVCPPTGALKIVRRYELGRRGRAGGGGGGSRRGRRLASAGGFRDQARGEVPAQGLAADLLPSTHRGSRAGVPRARTRRRHAGAPRPQAARRP
jgi:primosomal protein N'